MQTMERKTRRRRIPRQDGAGRLTSGTVTREARRQTAQRVRERTAASPQRRVVRRPQEEIPKVVYTRPKPLYPGRFILRLATVLAAVLALMLCLSAVFRVDRVMVSGTNRYTPWMIQEASGIQLGESLLGLNKDRAAGKVLSELPYVASLRIRVHLPGTIHMEIKEMDVVYGIQDSDGTWWLVSSQGKAVEQVHPASLEGHPRLLGVTIAPTSGGAQVEGWEELQPTEPAQSQPLESQPEQSTQPTEQTTQPTEQPQPSEPEESTQPTQMPVTNAQHLEAALSIAQVLEDCSVIGRIDSVDVTDLQELVVEYDGRIRVVLGDSSELSYKIRYMAQALRQLKDYETGVLDVSLRYYDEALFNPREEGSGKNP